ncbi:hybrid sensor histidine kinase/response regulator [Kaarinaea lacus]
MNMSMPEQVNLVPSAGQRARLLIVDDDAMLRNLMRIKLKRSGYEVCEAADGSEAVKVFEQHHPDIVLMDANMPDVDGFQATAEIKNHPLGSHTPILMVSGLEDDESVDRAFSAGAVEYITKPICWPLLLHRLANICAAMRAEAEIIQAKLNADRANQSKSEFLANMSHELRTPMHAILSFANMGEEKAHSAAPEKLNQYFTRIAQSGNRLLLLLNDLLDLSKLEAGAVECQFHKNDLAQIVANVLAELSGVIKESGVNVQVERTDSDTCAEFDADKIMQVVRNLVANAVKFTPSGKTVILSYQHSDIEQHNQQEPLPALLFSVEDEGIGIPADELEAVFDKFVQSSKTKTGAGGTGLGLAICKEIIDKHHGIIFAENNNHGGASFRFKIPLTQI